MKSLDVAIFICFGLAFWILGTLFYQQSGAAIFETTAARYWINFILTPLISTIACIALFRWRNIPTAAWSSAALLIAIPGLVSEALLLSNFSAWMPKMQPTSAGRYAGFLFATYGLVLAVAEAASLRAS